MEKRVKRLTTAQAIVEFLMNQYVERDGNRQKFFAGCFGIFGHGNVAGIGQALSQYRSFRYYQSRNEQAMVHTAIAYAKVKNRLQAFACTSSIGPGATNMVTGAATATIDHLPVLLLPGDIFSTRRVDPVLQQIESSFTKNISVNDCFKPVSRYWDRISRPEQLISAMMNAMRVLTSPADTGAVTIALPQDVQAEAFDFPEEFFEKRIWNIPRIRPDSEILKKAVEIIRQSKTPVIIAGGGVIYSDGCKQLEDFVGKTGIPVAETFSGKGSLRFDNPLNLGAVGVTGTPGAIEACREADVVIGIGTRYTDFTTVSQSAFQNPGVRFININVSEFDSFKQGAISLMGDARETLSELNEMLSEFSVSNGYLTKNKDRNLSWNKKVEELYSAVPEENKKPSQVQVIGAINNFSEEKDILLNAAGSLPGDLHKLWQTRDSKGFHLEYGYSCMGYEIAGGLGAKMADPSREIYVMVGDASYLMLSQEITTSIQEQYKMIIVIVDNHGFGSIGGLSASLGTEGFGTYYKLRDHITGQLTGENLPIDFVANAASLGAVVFKANDLNSFKGYLKEAKSQTKTTVIYIETDRSSTTEDYAWWDVPIAEVSEMESVNASYKELEEKRKSQRTYL